MTIPAEMTNAFADEVKKLKDSGHDPLQFPAILIDAALAAREPIAWLVHVAFPPDGGPARYEIAEPGEDNAFPVYDR